MKNNISIKNTQDIWYANPTCNCCTEKAEVSIIFKKEVMNNTEKVISLCWDCFCDLYNKIGESS